MKRIAPLVGWLPACGLLLLAAGANAQSFRVQCPSSTAQHPAGSSTDGSTIKCQQVAGGDGYASMADGQPIYLFGFGPLSGLKKIYKGLPGTEPFSVFNTTYGSAIAAWKAATSYVNGDVVQTGAGFYSALANGVSGTAVPSGTSTFCDGLAPGGVCSAVTWTYEGPLEADASGVSGSSGDFGTAAGNNLIGMPDNHFKFNGAIGLTSDVNVDPWTAGSTYLAGAIVRTAAGLLTASTAGVAGPTLPNCTSVLTSCSDGTITWQYSSSLLDGHVDPRPIMDVGVMNASAPAPLIAIDEDDELFLTLTNVGMIMRPDLFEQHTVHFHGYPNAASFYDGVPDASIAINVGGSFTYYYLAPDAGTYFWHCHIAPPEHLQMGMVGQLYVRPRQNRVPVGTALWSALNSLEGTVTSSSPLRDPGAQTTPAARAAAFAQYEPVRKRCGTDILCTSPLPAQNAVLQAVDPQTGRPQKYAYNDGDGTTRYDVEYPLQIHGFDPNFHFVGMTFNPESFSDMKDRYFTLNGRSYPDTVGGHACVANDSLAACYANNHFANGVLTKGAALPVGTIVPGAMQTQSTDGTMHSSQPLPSVINIPAGGRALLRISDLDVSEYQTLASLGIPMKVIGLNARLLRDMAGNNLAYTTSSITLAGGESIDVILDASGIQAGQKFYLYTPQLDHLANDAENFGGLMTEVNICGSVDPTTKVCGI